MLLLGAWYVTLLAFLFAFVCLIMMLVILIQKPRGGGLSGAFGGAGGSANAVFGSKTGDVLTWFTVGCFVLFLLLAMGLTWLIPTSGRGTPAVVPPTPAKAPANNSGADGGVIPTKPGAESGAVVPPDETAAPPTPTPQAPAPTPTPAPSDDGK